MQFLTPQIWEGQTSVISIVPQYLSRYKIPFADAVFTTFPPGEFLSQEIKGDGFSFWIHHFFIRSATVLMPLTKVPRVAILYTKKGTIDCELTGFGKVRLRQGKYKLFCIPPDTAHKAFFKTGDYCFFHLDLSRELILELNLSPAGRAIILQYLDNPKASGIKLYENTINPLVKSTIQSIQDCNITDKVHFKFFLKRQFSTLLCQFSKSLTEQRPGGSLEEDLLLLQNTIAHITGNLETDLSLGTLANIFTVSERKLKYLFHKRLSTTVWKFVFKNRMEAAKALLKETELQIKEIGPKVGYDDASAFARHFKAYTGSPPTDYRNATTK